MATASHPLGRGSCPPHALASTRWGLPSPPRPAGPTSPLPSPRPQGYFGCAAVGVNPLRRPCCPLPSTRARPAAKGSLRGRAQPPPPGTPVTAEMPWTLGRDLSGWGRGAEAGRGPATKGKVGRLGWLASPVHRGRPNRAPSATQLPSSWPRQVLTLCPCSAGEGGAGQAAGCLPPGEERGHTR